MEQYISELYKLPTAIYETLVMIFYSTIGSIILGFIPAIILVITKEDGLNPNKKVYKVLDFIINILRSLPFVILLAALIPLTRIVVGSAIGTKATIFPLIIASSPFVARIIESSLNEVDNGIIEAAKSFGASTYQIIFKVLLKEAIPSLILGITLSIINILGYSAMAGVVGGGGIGNLAIAYGLQRNNSLILIYSIISLIIIVQIIQTIGNIFYKLSNKNSRNNSNIKKNKSLIRNLIAIFCIVLLIIIAFIYNTNNTEYSVKTDKVITVGATLEPHVGILEAIRPEIEKSGYILKIKEFSDYTLINQALADGDIDANFFQHKPYLDQENAQKHLNLVSVASIHIEPLGIYSNKINSLNELKDNSIVAIPNDPSNEARALKLLEKQNIIKLNNSNVPNLNDIIKNPQNLKFKEINGEQLSYLIKDVDLDIINSNYALEGGLNPTKDAIVLEDSNSPYANILVVKNNDKNAEFTQVLKNALTSETSRKYLNSLKDKGIMPAF